MNRPLPALATMLFVLASAALGQDALEDAMAPDPGMGGPTCGEFVALDSVGRIGMLATIQPLGDEISAEDAGAARECAAEVARACGEDADRPLAEAAREALGE